MRRLQLSECAPGWEVLTWTLQKSQKSWYLLFIPTRTCDTLSGDANFFWFWNQNCCFGWFLCYRDLTWMLVAFCKPPLVDKHAYSCRIHYLRAVRRRDKERCEQKNLTCLNLDMYEPMLVSEDQGSPAGWDVICKGTIRAMPEFCRNVVFLQNIFVLTNAILWSKVFCGEHLACHVLFSLYSNIQFFTKRERVLLIL